MKRITLLSAAILVSFLLVVAGCGTKTATPVPDPTQPAATTPPAVPAPQPAAPAAQPAAPAVQEYTCPMHPEVRATQPGKCPKCGMDLVPVTKPSAAAPNAGGGCPCCGNNPV